ncbi:hypothetical protein G7Y89_g5994 [Cudoniella acicularis]|uniref:Uncharacterized protein n=1 Tax=Cudoniella acicularis TaxID=354080 RepID=A0A8H4RN25_9HELO|nr:hypothetical protein G7Y89_g5994 [Cudoniella acicularis]
MHIDHDEQDISYQNPGQDVEGQLCPEQGCVNCELRYAQSAASVGGSIDPVGLAASMLAFGGVISTGVSTVSDFRHAEKKRLKVHRQKELIRINEGLRKTLPANVQTHLHQLETSFAELDNNLPSQPQKWRKRDGLQWATGGKDKIKAELASFKDIESSASLTLLISIFENLLESQTSALNARLQQQLEVQSQQLELLESYTQAVILHGNCLHPERRRPNYVATMTSPWTWLLYLGVTMKLIYLNCDGKKKSTLSIRWPLFATMLLVWRVNISLNWHRQYYFSLKALRIIPENALVIQACKENNMRLIRQLFSDSEAHVNDITSNNLTLLFFAIRAGNYDIVKFLLEKGADSNQTFGARETSPLNDAFWKGDPKIIRLLLSHKADIEYVNNRTWTSITYLWDPVRPNHTKTTEILEICAVAEFDSWNYSDAAGWTPFHRAAAFGDAAHLEKLSNLEVIDRRNMPLTLCKWTPIQTAARFGNISTFEYLSRDVPTSTLRRMRDRRGWSLLHLAAESGSEKMLCCLLSLGLVPNATSVPTTYMVPEEMDDQSLTPRMIAEYYGHNSIYDSALMAAEVSDCVENLSVVDDT